MTASGDNAQRTGLLVGKAIEEIGFANSCTTMNAECLGRLQAGQQIWDQVIKLTTRYQQDVARACQTFADLHDTVEMLLDIGKTVEGDTASLCSSVGVVLMNLRRINEQRNNASLDMLRDMIPLLKSKTDDWKEKTTLGVKRFKSDTTKAREEVKKQLHVVSKAAKKNAKRQDANTACKYQDATVTATMLLSSTYRYREMQRRVLTDMLAHERGRYCFLARVLCEFGSYEEEPLFNINLLKQRMATTVALANAPSVLPFNKAFHLRAKERGYDVTGEALRDEYRDRLHSTVSAMSISMSRRRRPGDQAPVYSSLDKSSSDGEDDDGGNDDDKGIPTADHLSRAEAMAPRDEQDKHASFDVDVQSIASSRSSDLYASDSGARNAQKGEENGRDNDAAPYPIECVDGHADIHQSQSSHHSSVTDDPPTLRRCSVRGSQAHPDDQKRLSSSLDINTDVNAVVSVRRRQASKRDAPHAHPTDFVPAQATAAVSAGNQHAATDETVPLNKLFEDRSPEQFKSFRKSSRSSSRQKKKRMKKRKGSAATGNSSTSSLRSHAKEGPSDGCIGGDGDDDSLESKLKRGRRLGASTVAELKAQLKLASHTQHGGTTSTTTSTTASSRMKGTAAERDQAGQHDSLTVRAGKDAMSSGARVQHDTVTSSDGGKPAIADHQSIDASETPETPEASQKLNDRRPSSTILSSLLYPSSDSNCSSELGSHSDSNQRARSNIERKIRKQLSADNSNNDNNGNSSNSSSNRNANTPTSRRDCSQGQNASPQNSSTRRSQNAPAKPRRALHHKSLSRGMSAHAHSLTRTAMMRASAAQHRSLSTHAMKSSLRASVVKKTEL